MSGTLPQKLTLLFDRHIGRYGIMVLRENVDGQFGRIGSKGRTFRVTVWKDPRNGEPL